MRRLATVLLAIVTSVGNVALCHGWGSSAETRMACCLEGDRCPMHDDDAGGQSARSGSRAAVDLCCAEPAGDDAAPSPAHLPVAGHAGEISPPLTRRAAEVWPYTVRRLDRPVANGTVPRHLLLSVFLV